MTGLPSAYPRLVLLDSSAVFALTDTDDENHGRAHAIQRRLVQSRSRLITTNFLVDETYTLLRYRAGYRFAIAFLDRVHRGLTTVVRIEPGDEQRAEEILHQYSDKRLSYTDATSFAVMDRRHVDTAFAFDRNFAQYGLRTLEP